MTDRLGYRLKLGIVVPSTNSIVQPETDDMRPRGVTNHIGRIHIPDLPLTNDAEFEQIMTAIGPDLYGGMPGVALFLANFTERYCVSCCRAIRRNSVGAIPSRLRNPCMA